MEKHSARLPQPADIAVKSTGARHFNLNRPARCCRLNIIVCAKAHVTFAQIPVARRRLGERVKSTLCGPSGSAL